MTDEHQRLRESLGAYVVGALEPSERREVEHHLEGCTDCMAEAARFGVLPGLLGRVDPEEAASSQLVPSKGLLDGIVTALAEERSVLQRRLVRWRVATAAAAAAALIAGLVVAAPWDPGPDRLVATGAPVASDAAGATGEVAAIAWEWGTTVELDVEHLPPRPGYLLWAVAEDGRREQAGTWGPTASRGALVRGASSIQRDRLQRVEITDDAGTVLMAFPIP